MANPLIPDVKYATLITEGDGAKTEWEFNFAGGYISKDHVKAFTEDKVTGQIVIRSVDFIGPNTVRIAPAVANGLRLVIYRDTPKMEPIVNYTDGSVMSETNLDKSNQQAVFIAAELADRVVADYDFSNSLLYAVETATAASNTANAIDGKAQAALDATALALSYLSSLHGPSSDIQMYQRPTGLNLVKMPLRNRLESMLDAREFGIVSSPTIDQSELVRNAFAEAQRQGKVLNCGGLCIRIDTPIVAPIGFPGFKFDVVNYGSYGDSGFYYTGSGTAITIVGAFRCLEGAIYGSGQVANGLMVINPLLSRGVNIRIHKFSGFGMKVDRMWDSVMENISIEACGSASEYAFWFGETTDTSNMSVIGRLQVETAKEKAIYISPLALSCIINNIHSERATVTIPGTSTWVIGGNRCVYNGVRLDASGVGSTQSNAVAFFSGSNTTYAGVLVEGQITTSLNGFNGSTLVFLAPEIIGPFVTAVNQFGRISVIGGHIANASSGLVGLRFFGTTLTAVKVGDTSANPLNLVFEGCTIGFVESTSTNSAATFINTQILDGRPLATNKLVNSTWKVPVDITATFLRLFLNNSTFECPNLTLNSAHLNMVAGSRIKGNLLTTGNFQSISDSSSWVTGTCPTWAAPLFNTLFPDGVWARGMRAHNLTPAVGQPKGWLCTSPTGPWVSEGNL